MVEDENAPLLIGEGQCLQREASLDEALDPVETMVIASRQAAEEAGIGERIFSRLDAVGVVDVPGWRPRNAPRLLAEALGAKPRLEAVTALGGEASLALLNHLAREIRAGRVRAALVAGSNNFRTFRRAQQAKRPLGWPDGGDGEPTRIGVDRAGSSGIEQRYGLILPPFVYPLFENALRAQRGLDLATHRACMGTLMSRISRVAASNPHAWFPVARSPEELTTPGPENRMICFPYPKYLNAVLETDQAAAVLLVSAAEARALGVPSSRPVHWWGGGAAVEAAWYPTERPSFSACEALRASALGALGEAGVSLGEIGAFDFYSCFPVAVEMACEMLDLAEDDPRGLTVAGGLPYFGGPGNNYSLHAVVSMCDRLRRAPGAKGLVTGNGWYLTKHTATVLGSAPRASGGPQIVSVPSEPAAAVPLVDAASGPARIETYTVVFGRDGTPEKGIVVGRLESGGRFLAHTPDDRALLEGLCQREGVGVRGNVAVEDDRHIFRPS
ncbi:acetyl-CoA C-acetyltransferase [Myxococcaceae bacterium]|jgi:acetyl-CoA C-acetyltransferase|nr:acetyl-CoA C-acetyltransferase [Myxococcaceae bacterium]